MNAISDFSHPMQKGAVMRKISLPMTALGFILFLSPAYACDTTSKDKGLLSIAGDIASLGKKAVSVFTDVNDGNYLDAVSGLYDVINDAGNLIDELSGNKDSDTISLEEAKCDLEKHAAQVFDLLHDDHRQQTLIGALNDAEDAFNKVLSGAVRNGTCTSGSDCLQTVDDKSSDAVRTFDGGFGVNNFLFLRTFDVDKDAALMTTLNRGCPTPKCVYSDADLGDKAGFYDWSLALPPLLMYISQRIQVMAAIYPEFFLDPDKKLPAGSWGGPDIFSNVWKREIAGYVDTLMAHYNKILSGIKCGYLEGICADIHSRYQLSSKDLGKYGIYRDLPLHELKSMIATLQFYLLKASDRPTDLTQNYHRVPAFWPVRGIDRCLEATKSEFGYSVALGYCNDSKSQDWVYDRARGTIRNSGSVVDPASGQCLGVIGSTLPLRVIASKCADDPKDVAYYKTVHKLQQWLYDAKSNIVYHGTGTVLKFTDGNSAVWTAPRLDTPEYLWRAEGFIAGKTPFSDTMNPGEILHKGESRVSHDNTYELILQMDGNLVLYDKTPTAIMPDREMPHAIWASNTNGRAVDRVVMQTDGNLAMYPPSDPICLLGPSLNVSVVPGSCSGRTTAVWQSNTRGHPSSHLRVQDDGSVAIYDQNSAGIWLVP